MGAFRNLVDDLELKEIKLLGRMFTWSNSRTHTRIDRAFRSSEWDLILPNCGLQAVSSLVSDHCLLPLVGNTAVRNFRGFKFESFWQKIRLSWRWLIRPGNRSVSVTNPFLCMHTKLQRKAVALRTWAHSMFLYLLVSNFSNGTQSTGKWILMAD